MKKLFAGLLFFALLLAPALAQTNTNPGIYDATPDTIIDGQRAPVLMDSLRRQIVLADGGVASGATDSGNPVKVGCVFNSTLPTFTTGQRGDCQIDNKGNLRSLAVGSLTVGADAFANSNLMTWDRSTVPGTQLMQQVAGFIFNGTSWDREFTCPNSAVVNVTAGSTTQIVALVSSQIIRVCGFSVAMSAAGTAKFVYGTGANCGTGTTDITGAMPLATGTPWAMNSGSGSVIRTIASNALCVTAVTGNVVGFVNYAQY